MYLITAGGPYSLTGKPTTGNTLPGRGFTGSCGRTRRYGMGLMA
ncbi:hypothetical protein AAJ76_1770004087 [Vairimorpha ceranae]|uniref:Uncharacterized protein n=1 Tax=Vairimorpha ceranae TaxID=40302 RepID=A0A0F9WAG0_9MICR|nr:hypothetical protein AAJ76_1770004087 [Vairimorpha ceranae]KKO73915.1 hypothetical protein AAJ76_1770004087 [Vairimorpha ceranae]